jgi:hypothetical protein
LIIFFKWAIENGYNEKLEIDRINTNGDYSPENCRWINKRTNSNNKRNNRYFEIDGEIKTLFEWARIYCINYKTLQSRLRNGFKIIDALKIKVDKRMRNNKIEMFNIGGIVKSRYDWSEVFQISESAVIRRMKKGMTLAEALGLTAQEFPKESLGRGTL